jgi:hypothetical protein
MRGRAACVTPDAPDVFMGKIPRIGRFSIAALVALGSAAAAGRSSQRQTIAPHEVKASVALAPIVWPTPLMPDGPVEFESAEQRAVRLVVITKSLEQPWSIASGKGPMAF